MTNESGFERARSLRDTVAKAVDKAYELVDTAYQYVYIGLDKADEFVAGMDAALADEEAQQAQPAKESVYDDVRAPEPEGEPGGTDKEPSREQKITTVRQFLSSQGADTGRWFDDADSLSDAQVDLAYRLIEYRNTVQSAYEEQKRRYDNSKYN